MFNGESCNLSFPKFKHVQFFGQLICVYYYFHWFHGWNIFDCHSVAIIKKAKKKKFIEKVSHTYLNVGFENSIIPHKNTKYNNVSLCARVCVTREISVTSFGSIFCDIIIIKILTCMERWHSCHTNDNAYHFVRACVSVWLIAVQKLYTFTRTHNRIMFRSVTQKPEQFYIFVSLKVCHIDGWGVCAVRHTSIMW